MELLLLILAIICLVVWLCRRLFSPRTDDSINRGTAYAVKGEYDRAIQAFDQALHLDPNSAAAFVGRGDAYAKQGEYDRAIRNYYQALQINPNLALAYVGRGSAYLDKGQFDHAIQAFDEASRRLDLNNVRAYYKQADLARVYYKRSNAYERKGEYGRSIQDFKRPASSTRTTPRLSRPGSGLQDQGRVRPR